MNDIDIAHLDTLAYERARREIDECRLILHAHWVAFNHLGELTIDYDEWDDIACRLDRLDTPFVDLWYYILMSSAKIDKLIWRSLTNKKNFHEGRRQKFEPPPERQAA